MNIDSTCPGPSRGRQFRSGIPPRSAPIPCRRASLGLLSILWIGLLAGAGSPERPADPHAATSAADSARALIRDLENRVRDRKAPDSLRVLLAVRLREIGTIEGRLRAVSILEDLWRRDHADSRVGLELARTYVASSRASNAIEVLDTMTSLDSANVVARLMVSRMVLREMLHYGRRDGVGATERLLLEVQRVDPQNRDALYYRSILAYIRRVGDPSPMRWSWEARGLTEEILRDSDTDDRACLWNGVHCLDLGDEEDAGYWFLRGIRLLPLDVAEDFIVPEALGTRLDPALGRVERNARIHRYWNEHDPTPLTPANETLLRYWRNMVIADLYYGNPEKGLRGWKTDAGRSIVLFGPPAAAFFDPGYITQEGYTPPRLSMSYETGLTLAFVQVGLSPRWSSTPGAAGVVKEAIERGVAAVPPMTKRSGPDLYAMRTARRGIDGDDRSREACILAIPRWSDREDWWEGARVRMRMLDSSFVEVASCDLLVDGGDVHELTGDSDGARLGLIIGHDFRLHPGTYVLETGIQRANGEGAARDYRFAVNVPMFDRAALRLSEIDLALHGTFRGRGQVLPRPERLYLPNPAGVVGSDGRFDVVYSIYNLTPDERGRGSYEVGYMIVPLGDGMYDLDLRARHASAAKSPATDALHYAGGSADPALEGLVVHDLDRQKVEFQPVEVAPLQPGAEIRKMASLSLRGMPDGDYLVRVIVTDRVLGQTVMSETRVRKVPDAALDRLGATAAR